MILRDSFIFDMKPLAHTPQNEFEVTLQLLLKKKAHKLMILFIQEGPEALRKRIGAHLDHHWTYIFDYLVFSEEVLYKCVSQFLPFFKNVMIEKGPCALRSIFQIENSKYDPVFEKLIDFIGISHGAILDYVYLHRSNLARKIFSGQGSEIRKELGLSANKYDAMWFTILEILQQVVCKSVEDETALERGIQSFDIMMNGLRTHRSLRTYKRTKYLTRAGE